MSAAPDKCYFFINIREQVINTFCNFVVKDFKESDMINSKPPLEYQVQTEGFVS